MSSPCIIRPTGAQSFPVANDVLFRDVTKSVFVQLEESKRFFASNLQKASSQVREIDADHAKERRKIRETWKKKGKAGMEGN